VRKELVRKAIVAVALLVICPLLFAQAPQALNNDSIIKLVKTGLSEDLIVTTIKSSPGTYDTSEEGLFALKLAGASEAVITAIVQKNAVPAPVIVIPTPPPTPTPPPPPDMNDPNLPHDPGVYLMTTTPDGKRKMVFIDLAGAGSEKKHRGLNPVSAAMEAEIPGLHAAVRTADSNPVFYMYFSSGGNIGGSGSISNPSQFSLLSLESKKDHRETILPKETGTNAKGTIPLNSERIHPYVYKVAPSGSLKAGEYAFFASKGGGSTQSGPPAIYDFGVDAK
jgi:hypothetical protein